GLEVEAYPDLPLVVGEDAPSHTAQLLSVLVEFPYLFERVTAAIRVGERRWNIRIKSKDNRREIEVKLPEENPEKAWERLDKLVNSDKILEKDIRTIDLR